MNPISQKQTPNHFGLPGFGVTINILDGVLNVGNGILENEQQDFTLLVCL